jgi:microcystin-dependent protein
MAKLLWNDLPQWNDGNGDPYAGAQLFFYAAGSSTKQTVYQDSGSITAHSNPIVLDANGRVPSAVWATEGSSYKIVLAPSDDTDPPASPIFNVDGLTGINDASVSLEQWSDSGFTPTYVSTTQFTVAGDQTSTLHVGRRVKVSDGGGTKYGYITASAYTTLTTVTVSLDSGNLETPTSTLYIGVQTTTDPSEPLLMDSYPLRSGSSDRTKKLRIELDGITTATTRVATAPDYDFRFGNLPAGIGPLPYAGATVPTGWLECDGSAVSRTTYSALFTAISTTFGTGDGTTTFNLPDMRGKVAIGAGTGTTSEAVTASSSNGFTVASNSTKWITGMTVVLSDLTGFTTSATAGPTYYAVRVSSTNVRLATTLALAQAGSPDVTLSGTGTATLTHTFTARTLGEQGGEEGHAMSSSELLAHTHSEEGVVNSGTDEGAGQTHYVPESGTTGSAGGNAAMNIMQPFLVTKYIISY